KALALGAQAVCVGRPYLWGLGAFGQPGVERVLEILRAETRTAMRQLGAPSLKDITPNMVRRVLKGTDAREKARVPCASLPPGFRPREDRGPGTLHSLS